MAYLPVDGQRRGLV